MALHHLRYELPRMVKSLPLYNRKWIVCQWRQVRARDNGRTWTLELRLGTTPGRGVNTRACSPAADVEQRVLAAPVQRRDGGEQRGRTHTYQLVRAAISSLGAIGMLGTN